MIKTPKIHEILISAISKAGCSYTDGTFKGSEDPNTETYYFSASPKRATSLVILLHGTGDHALYPGFQLILDLIRNGNRTFSFDLPGHGPISTSSFSLASAKNCLGEAFLKASDLAGDLPIHILAQSLGGILAVYSLRKKLLPIRSLCLIGVPIELNIHPRIIFPEVYFSLTKDLWTIARDLGIWKVLPAFGPLKRNEVPFRYEHQDNYLPFGYLKKVKNLIKILDVRYYDHKPLPIPTLGIYGSQDLIAPIHHGRNLVQNFEPNHLEVLEKTNHFMLSFCAATANLVQNWIRLTNNKEL
jgi:pimeloyl-ACP methyl ester carboxylesterase